MAINSKRKGKTGELELAKILREYGFEKARRSQQYAGGTEESADLIGLPYIHIECKRVERLNIENAMEQAEMDCKGEKLPAVFHRKNGKQWLVTMPLDKWMEVYQEYYSGKKIAEMQG